MTRVIIQPSYGNPDARRHWADTLAQDVQFDSEPYASALTVDEMRALKKTHPSGQGFWGATSNHDAKMVTLAPGDVVLFTGQKKVLAIGEVGANLHNKAFGDALWDAHPTRGSYNNVYSLLSFQETDIDYQEVWDLPGFNEGDNFMGLRFLDDDKSRTVIEGLQIDPLSPYKADVADESATIAKILTAAGRVVDPEGVHTTSTSYERPGGTVIVRRAESLLVQLYRDHLPSDLTANRLHTPVGLTDLHVVSDDWIEIIEAKRSSEHGFVRQALGQLLDYALHSPTPATRLTALFPDRPSDQDLFLLHNYGIDCTYLGDDNDFVRDDAPEALRVRSWPLWHPAP